MRIPNRFAPIAFGGMLSAIMVAVVSAVVLAINQGIQQGFAWVRRVVGRLTAQP